MHRDPEVLAALGLRRGEVVRFKRLPGTKWLQGTLLGVETDGCLALLDVTGVSRSIPTERVEVRRASGRNRSRWCAVNDVATTWEQLPLW